MLEFSTPIQSNEAEEVAQSVSSRHVGSLLLEPRSLLILQEDMYTSYLHGISPVKQDTVSRDMFNYEQCTAKLGDVLTRGTRISLTIRHVPKVLKAKLILGRRRQ